MPTGRPTISNTTETSLTLSWPAARLPAYLKNTKVDYIIEARESSSRLWANLAENVTDTTYKVVDHTFHEAICVVHSALCLSDAHGIGGEGMRRDREIIKVKFRKQISVQVFT